MSQVSKWLNSVAESVFHLNIKPNPDCMYSYEKRNKPTKTMWPISYTNMKYEKKWMYEKYENIKKK